MANVDERPGATLPISRNVAILQHLVQRATTDASIARLLACTPVLDALLLIDAVDETARGMDL